MRLKIIKELNIGDLFTNYVYVNWKEEGIYNENNKIFHLTYYIKNNNNIVKPFYFENKIVDIYDNYGVFLRKEERSIKTYLPLKIKTNKTNNEIRTLIENIQIEDTLTKLVFVYFELIKEELIKLIGENVIIE